MQKPGWRMTLRPGFLFVFPTALKPEGDAYVELVGVAPPAFCGSGSRQVGVGLAVRIAHQLV